MSKQVEKCNVTRTLTGKHSSFFWFRFHLEDGLGSDTVEPRLLLFEAWQAREFLTHCFRTITSLFPSNLHMHVLYVLVPLDRAINCLHLA